MPLPQMRRNLGLQRMQTLLPYLLIYCKNRSNPSGQPTEDYDYEGDFPNLNYQKCWEEASRNRKCYGTAKASENRSPLVWPSSVAYPQPERNIKQIGWSITHKRNCWSSAKNWSSFSATPHYPEQCTVRPPQPKSRYCRKFTSRIPAPQA